MELLNKIINQIRKVFGLDKIKKQQLLLEEDNIRNKNDLVASNNNKSALYEFDDIFQETTKSTDESISVLADDTREELDKEEFFRMYKAYKEGKIKEEHLLITDLIDIQLMLLEETKLIEQKTSLENDKNKKRQIQLNTLLKKKAELEKKHN